MADTDRYVLQPPNVGDPYGMWVLGERNDEGQYEVYAGELPDHLRGRRGFGPHYGPDEEDRARAALAWLQTPEDKREHSDPQALIAALQAEIAELRRGH